MNLEDLYRRVTAYRESAEEAKRALDVELRHFPAIVTREVDRLRKSEADALRLLILSELLAGFIEDPDATTAWMAECVEAGEIVQRGEPVEDDW